jgi:hypothetical protein
MDSVRFSDFVSRLLTDCFETLGMLLLNNVVFANRLEQQLMVWFLSLLSFLKEEKVG